MSKVKVFAGVVVAAVAGFTAGILTAPKSGKETRKELKDAGLKAKDVVVEETAKFKESAEADFKKFQTAAEQTAQDVRKNAEEVIDHAGEKADELKQRSTHAFGAAREAFSKDPKAAKKK